MKIESKPDDRCGNCGHGKSVHLPQLPGSLDHECHGELDHVRCVCTEFVPPIVARLVEAIEHLVGAGFAVPFEFHDRRIRETYRGDRGAAEADRKCLDLLVECGRMTKDGGTYRWKGEQA